MDITVILKSIITLIFAILTGFLIPYIRNKMSTDSYYEMIRVVRILVQAAEQIFGAGRGADKKKYVIEKLISYGFDEQIIDDLIESAVLEMNKAIEV